LKEFAKLPLINLFFNRVKPFFDMYSYLRVLFLLCLITLSSDLLFAQNRQDKELARTYMEQAELILADTKAEDEAREIIVTAANLDTTFIQANFEAGYMHLITIGKELAVKYFLRIYRQDPNYRFDLEFWIGKSYQYGLQFDKAIDFYNRYRDKLIRKPNYLGKDKIELKVVDRNIEECKNGKEFVANPQPYSIINMGREINSEFIDYGPVFNADESEVIFTTRRRDGNTYENVAIDNKPYEDVFIAKKVGGSWKKAQNIGLPINSKFGDSNLTLSPDGQTLFLYKDEGNGDIYESERQKDGTWSEPEALTALNSSYRESSVSITADGNTIYFASERPGGYGASDIYYSVKDSNGEWSRIKNLGTTINTEYEEDGPFISYDGKTLYFSSKGKKGMGEYDIFKTTLINADKNEWTEPENIGYPINSPDNDVFFSTSKDGKRWYYSSLRDDGIGYEDIYEILPIEPKKEPIVAKTPDPIIEEPKIPLVQPKVEPKVEPIVEPVKPSIVPIKYVVRVVDAESESPIDAKVRMQGSKDNSPVGMTNNGTEYEFSLASTKPKDYRLSIEREGYIFQNLTVKVEAATEKEKTITNTIRMRKLVVGAVSILRNIYFDFDKATFKTEAYPELNKLEAMMKQNQNLSVEIAGHTDSFGSKIVNMNLSERRARAVKSFLTSKGIDPRRVSTIGYGEERPLASNDDEEEGRQLNRRVEFKVLGN
jgi:outer membrane protein OmpA-like peptidoglycan-associated protein